MQWSGPAQTPTPPVCLPLVPRTDASGMATCVALVSLGAGQSCSGMAGLTVPDPAIVTSVQQTLQAEMSTGATALMNPCEVSQLAAPCDTGTQPGWCYVTGTNAPPGCASAVTFSTGFPPAGSVLIVACH
jgi:hypothetical protein